MNAEYFTYRADSISPRLSTEMITFELYVNGEKKAASGFQGAHVMSAHITSVSFNEDHPAGPKDEVMLDLGGLDTIANTHWSWFHSDDLKAGDEIMIRVSEGAEFNPPKPRELPSKEEILANEKKHMRCRAKEFGWTIVENDNANEGDPTDERDG